jgi:hypothetical protein
MHVAVQGLTEQRLAVCLSPLLYLHLTCLLVLPTLRLRVAEGIDPRSQPASADHLSTGAPFDQGRLSDCASIAGEEVLPLLCLSSHHYR